MILDTYLFVQQIKDANKKQVKFEEDENYIGGSVPSRIAYDYYGTQQQGSVSTSGMILGLLLSIIVAIFVAYIFYNCIKTNCMSFIVFLVFLVLLNIPVVNIFAFIGLIIYWLVYCRKGCRLTR